MSTDWQGVERALRGWVKSATGFDDDHVYWAVPNAARPSTGPFVTLQILDAVSQNAFPEEITQLVDGGDPGADLQFTAQELLSCGFRVQVYSQPARAGSPAPPHGSASAFAIANKILRVLGLSSTATLLDAANISVYERGSVQSVPEMVGADFEGRAVLDCRFYVVDFVTEFTTYIAEVIGQGTVSGADSGDVPVDFDADSSA